MCTEEIRAYVLAELRSQDDEVARLVEIGKQLTGRRHNAHDLQPMLQGIEGIIDHLQSLHDRCLEKFPDAEADGRTDPCLAYLRDQIRKWHTLWDGWNMPIA
jgi:hypothetical protein